MATTKTKTKRMTKVTKGAIMAHLATARKVNLDRQAKGHFVDKGAERLATAIVKAHTFPTLTQAKIHKKGYDVSRLEEDAEARRDYARANRAPLVAVSDIIGQGKKGKITHDRPENTVRSRLRSIARAFGLPEDTYYAVRSGVYKEGEVPKVYIVRL